MRAGNAGSTIEMQQPCPAAALDSYSPARFYRLRLAVTAVWLLLTMLVCASRHPRPDIPHSLMDYSECLALAYLEPTSSIERCIPAATSLL